MPEALARSQHLAAAAAAELTRDQAKLQEAQRTRQAVQAGTEVIHLDARLAQANNELQQAQVRSDFAHLVLGRECVAAGFEPAQAAKLLAEIRRRRQ